MKFIAFVLQVPLKLYISLGLYERGGARSRFSRLEGSSLAGILRIDLLWQ